MTAKRITATVAAVLALGAAGASAGICTKDGQAADPCCCRQTDQGLVCTKTGEVLAECCCE